MKNWQIYAKYSNNNTKIRLGNDTTSTVFTVNIKRIPKPTLGTQCELKRYICSLFKDKLYCSGLYILNVTHLMDVGLRQHTRRFFRFLFLSLVEKSSRLTEFFILNGTIFHFILGIWITRLNTVIAEVLSNFSHYQLSEFTTVAFRKTKTLCILSIIRVNIPVSYQNSQR